jgi:hypothetical protein
VVFGQYAEYGKVDRKGNFYGYITKEQDTISVGDTLRIGIPSSPYGFIFLTQGGASVASWLSGNEVEIVKIESIGNEKRGFKIYFHFKGYGMMPVLIDYESALRTKEIEPIE